MTDLDPKFQLSKAQDRMVVRGVMEVAEEELRGVGARVLQYAFQGMAKDIVYTQKVEVEKVCAGLLANGEWVEETLRLAFAEVVKEYMNPWGPR